MKNRLNGAGLFSQAISGLTNTFGYLGQGENLTLDKLKNPGENVNKSLVNSQFQMYLSSNFGKIDSNGDGEITSDEFQNYTNTMANKGMTLEELGQLCSQYGYTNSLLETVMSNFQQIDKNHDGRVTNQEIAAFGIDQEIEEMKDDFQKFDPKAMSIFYTPSSDTEEV